MSLIANGTIGLAIRTLPENFDRGRIVTVIETIEQELYEGGVYTVSKAAIAQLTKAMAVEYAPKGVRVNAIAPGVVETPMIRQAGMDPARLKLFLDRIPMQRFAKPEEIVGPAQFLASSTAAYVTGVKLEEGTTRGGNVKSTGHR